MSFKDDLADLTGFTETANGQTVIDGRFYSTQVNPVAVALRNQTFTAGNPIRFVSRARYRDKINGGIGNSFGIVVTSNTAAQIASFTLNNTIGIYINQQTSQARRVEVNIRGTVYNLGSVSGTNADYIFAIQADEEWWCLTCRRADGVEEFASFFPRDHASLSGWTPTKVGMFVCDGRTTNGSSPAGPIGLRDDGTLNPITPKTNLEDVCPVPFYREINATQCRIAIPITYSPSTPAALGIYGHGGNGNYHEINSNAIVGAQFRALQAQEDIILAASQYHGNTFGNSQSISDISEMYDWIDTHYNLDSTKVLGFGLSMGAITLLQEVMKDTFPMAGFFGGCAGTNLGRFEYIMRTQPTNPLTVAYKAAFATAWGLSNPWTEAEYLTATGPQGPPYTGYDPQKWAEDSTQVYDFFDTAILICNSPDDTAAEWDYYGHLLYLTLDAAGHPWIEFEEGSGDHCANTTQWPQAVINDWAGRVLAAELPESGTSMGMMI